MKNYKLIKKLPFEDSPEIGYISKPKLINDEYGHYWNNSCFKPEKYPEFWEPITKKEYEIIELYEIIINSAGQNEKLILDKKENSLFYYSNEDVGAFNGNVLLTNNANLLSEKYPEFWCDDDVVDFQIHSIKRLSDGEIFKVGDKVSWNWSKSTTSKYFTIYEFFIDNKLKFNTVEESVQGFDLEHESTLSNESLLAELKHYKPVLTTHDGVEIFPNNKYYFIDKNYNNAHKPSIIENVAKTGFYIGEDKQFIYFSTEEKAEEFLLLNKKSLSINDVIETIKEDSTLHLNIQKKLLNLVKNG